MSYGIMAMQLNMLAPSGGSPEEIATQVLGFDHAWHLRRIAVQGFKLIELGGDLILFFPNSYSPAALAQIAALQAELGLRFTVHLPLWSVEPSTLLQPVRAGSVQALVDCVRATQALDPEMYVLHATGALAAEFSNMRLPGLAKSMILKQFQANAMQSIQTLLSETGLPSRKLAIETIEFPFELLMELAETLDTSICLDTGHILAGFSGPVELFDVLERILPRLGEIHLHDAPWQGPQQHIGYGKDHQALGKGDLDVKRLLDRLSAAGWDGPVIFELTVEEAQESLEELRRLGFSPDPPSR